MKSPAVVALFAQLLWTDKAAASRCRPSLAPSSASFSSSSISSAASYSSSSSSSADADNSAATYYPPSSGSYSSFPSFSPPPSVSVPSSSSSVHQPPSPSASVSPCSQLIQDPTFALGQLGWDVTQNSAATLVFPNAAGCAPDHSTCAELALGPTGALFVSVVLSQKITTQGAIVDGAKYQIYVQYRIVSNSPAAGAVVNLVTDVDRGLQTFVHDATNENSGGGGPGPWTFLHYQYTAVGTSMTVTLSLAGTAITPNTVFATTVQIGEVNVVGCRSTSSSAIPTP